MIDEPNWANTLPIHHSRLGSGYAISLPPGWRVLVTDLFSDLDAALASNRKGTLTWHELTQQRGALWVRYTARKLDPRLAEAVERRIKQAIGASLRTCEVCGARGQLTGKGALRRVTCPVHSSNDGAARRLSTPRRSPSPYPRAPARRRSIRTQRGGARPCRSLVPYRQGDLDSLCGVYAIINACRALCPELTASGSLELFAVLVTELHFARDRPIQVLWRGMGPTLLRRLLKAAINYLRDEHVIQLTAHALAGRHRTTTSLADLWIALRAALDGTQIAVIGLRGRHDHWTVACRASERTLWLLDSGERVLLPRSNCAIRHSRRRYWFTARDIVLIRRIAQRS